MSLLRDIQDAAIDRSVDLASLLRKCLVLAKRLKHDDLSAWATHELNGYGNADPLPPYRRLNVQSFGDFSGPFGSGLKNAPIPKFTLPVELQGIVDESSLREPVAELTELAASNGVVHGKWPADIIGLCQARYEMYQDMKLMHAWQSISPSTIAGVLDTIRTRVLEFALAVEERAPDAGDVPPGAASAVNRETVNQIFNVTINGGQSNVGTSGGAAIAAGHTVNFGAGVSAAAHAELKEALAAIRLQIDQMGTADRADATYALAKVEAELASAAPNTTTVERYLGLLANITTVVAPYIETIQRVLAGFG